MIADHVLGYILCFARNLHVYSAGSKARPCGNQSAARWPASTFAAGPGTVSTIDAAHLHLADCTLGIVGLGAIGAEIARRGLAFGMRVLASIRVQTAAPDGVEALWPHGPLAGVAGRERFRRHRRAAHAGDGEAVRRRTHSRR